MNFGRASLSFALLVAVVAACGEISPSASDPSGPSPSSSSSPTKPGDSTKSDAGEDGSSTTKPDGGGPDKSDAGAPSSRAEALDKYCHSTCNGWLGLSYKGTGKEKGTYVGGHFGRYSQPRVCTVRAAGSCVYISRAGDPSSSSFHRGGITYKSSVGERFVDKRGDGYLTGITNTPLIPPVGETIGVKLRDGTPTARAFDLPAPGEVAAITVPAARSKIARGTDVTVSWMNGAVTPSSTVLVSLYGTEGNVECLVNASPSSVTIPGSLTAPLSAGVADIAVIAESERFDSDDECMVQTAVTRAMVGTLVTVTLE